MLLFSVIYCALVPCTWRGLKFFLAKEYFEMVTSGEMVIYSFL
jgi:hypothetical protein